MSTDRVSAKSIGLSVVINAQMAYLYCQLYKIGSSDKFLDIRIASVAISFFFQSVIRPFISKKPEELKEKVFFNLLPFFIMGAGFYYTQPIRKIDLIAFAFFNTAQLGLYYGLLTLPVPKQMLIGTLDQTTSLSSGEHTAKGPPSLFSHNILPFFPHHDPLPKGKALRPASLSLSSPTASAVSAMTFDKAAWEKYFGDIGEEPSLPADIATILASPCPIWSDKKIQETHVLILVPAKVNGEPLTLESLEKLVKNPKEGNATQYRSFFPGKNEQASVEQNTWVLLTNNILPGSVDQSYNKQVTLVNELAKKAGAPYEVPQLIVVAVSLFVHYVRSGELLYANSSGTYNYTHCQEKGHGQYLTFVGGFSYAGLCVRSHTDDDLLGYGVGAMRKF
ncbi:MAG: hypothetical protein HYZ47_03560 [Simkania negevensis]|nr:hypothetical protein [Simkania negevensis]